MRDWVWLGPIITALMYFGFVEGWALAHHKGAWTLSAGIRRWLGIDPPKWWKRYAFAGLAIFVGWFIPHILNG